MKERGFTLIELAVVIAIIAILAAVAIPRFGNTTAQAEAAKIKDLAAQLSSAASIYTAEQAATPAGFTNFVTAGPMPTGRTNFTISIRNFTDPPGRCNGVTATRITCQATAFKKWNSVTYTFNQGIVTVSANPTGGNNLPAIRP